MKQLSKPLPLTAICTLGGFVCLLLRQWLFGSGLDSEGLLRLSHPANILSWVLTGLTAILLIILFVTWDKHVTCTFPLTPMSGVATLILAGGYAIAAWQLLMGQPLQLLSIVCGALAAVSLLCSLLIAVGLFRGVRMHPLLYCPGVLFFLCYLILRYSTWSGEPQHQDFFFQMMSTATMLVSVFCRAELAAGKINGRNYLLFSRAAIFTGIAAVSHSENGLLYLLFALALLLDGCQTSRKEPKEPEPNPQGE